MRHFARAKGEQAKTDPIDAAMCSPPLAKAMRARADARTQRRPERTSAELVVTPRATHRDPHRRDPTSAARYTDTDCSRRQSRALLALLEQGEIRPVRRRPSPRSSPRTRR